MTGAAEAGSPLVITSPFAWPHVRRGSEAVLHGLASWLRARGTAVEILAGGPHDDAYEIDGVPVSLVAARDLRRIHRDLDGQATIVPAMARALRRQRPRLVHSFLYHDATAARLARVPYVISYEGIAMPSSFAGRPLSRQLFRYATAGARALVCPSRAAADHLRSTYGHRAEVIPNGLDTARFAVDEATQPGLILSAATADDRRKRGEVLLDAFAVVAARRPDAELALAGAVADDRRAALLERVPPEIRPRVRVLGELDRDALVRWYARAAVTCLPSLHEAFGMVLIESLAAGTPVVGARHGAIREIIDGEVGATFVPDDVADCARALDEVLDAAGAGDPSLAAACRARASRYDWDTVGPEYVDLYDRVA